MTCPPYGAWSISGKKMAMSSQYFSQFPFASLKLLCFIFLKSETFQVRGCSGLKGSFLSEEFFSS